MFGKFKGQKTLNEIIKDERNYAEHISGWSGANTVRYHYMVILNLINCNIIFN